MASKPVNVRVPDRLYSLMEEEMEKGGFSSMSEYVLENFRYYLDRDLYAIRDRKELVKEILESLQSEGGHIALSVALNELLDERARKKYGEDL